MDCGERIPGWCVLVGLIGSGQEIHVGEEAGLGQWRTALEKAGDPGGWTVLSASSRPDPSFDATAARLQWHGVKMLD